MVGDHRIFVVLAENHLTLDLYIQKGAFLIDLDELFDIFIDLLGIVIPLDNKELFGLCLDRFFQFARFKGVVSGKSHRFDLGPRTFLDDILYLPYRHLRLVVGNVDHGIPFLTVQRLDGIASGPNGNRVKVITQLKAQLLGQPCITHFLIARKSQRTNKVFFLNHIGQLDLAIHDLGIVIGSLNSIQFSDSAYIPVGLAGAEPLTRTQTDHRQDRRARQCNIACRLDTGN